MTLPGYFLLITALHKISVLTDHEDSLNQCVFILYLRRSLCFLIPPTGMIFYLAQSTWNEQMGLTLSGASLEDAGRGDHQASGLFSNIFVTFPATVIPILNNQLISSYPILCKI